MFLRKAPPKEDDESAKPNEEEDPLPAKQVPLKSCRKIWEIMKLWIGSMLVLCLPFLVNLPVCRSISSHTNHELQVPLPKDEDPPIAKQARSVSLQLLATVMSSS